MADEDKTEEATPHRLEQARSKGDVPKSREFINFFILFGATMSLYFTSQFMLKKAVFLFQHFFDFQAIKLNTLDDFMALSHELMGTVLIFLAPLLATILVFGISSHLGQFGLLFTTEKLSPDITKLNPISGFGRLFSADSAIEMVKSSLKIIVVSALFYLILRGDVDRLIEVGAEPIGSIFLYLMELLGRMMMALLIFMAVLGVSDFFYSKWNYARKMKMSLHEVKEESKNRDGNPMVRSRIRQIARDRLRARMMEAVPKADVVVTNPTHVAVALKYTRGEMRAPVVIAKGAGYIALRIKEIAAEAAIPILERKQLARFIYRNVEVNEPIPESLYTAVAEVLAYVYKMKKRFSQWRESHAS